MVVYLKPLPFPVPPALDLKTITPVPSDVSIACVTNLIKDFLVQWE